MQYPQYQNPQARRPTPAPPRRPAFANLHSGLPPMLAGGNMAPPKPPMQHGVSGPKPVAPYAASPAMQTALNATAQGLTLRPNVQLPPQGPTVPGGYDSSGINPNGMYSQPSTGPRPAPMGGGAGMDVAAQLRAMQQARAQQRGPAYRPAFSALEQKVG